MKPAASPNRPRHPWPWAVRWAAVPALLAFAGFAEVKALDLDLTPARTAASSYDTLVLSHGPVGYWALAPGVTTDASGHGLDGAFSGSPQGTTMPNGDAAPVFDGVGQYFGVPDDDFLEIARTGILTLEAWLRPDVLDFPAAEPSADGPYVHWMGKGIPSQHSWVARIYNLASTRPNRISGYAFNLGGGLGAGSYFQDPVVPGEWIHYALTINTVQVSPSYPTGYTKVFKNGVLRDQDSLSGYNIVPGNGTAPFRVATRDLASFFKGAIGKVAIYDYELAPETLEGHRQEMSDLIFRDGFESSGGPEKPE